MLRPYSRGYFPDGMECTYIESYVSHTIFVLVAVNAQVDDRVLSLR